MPITHTTPVRNAVADAVLGRINLGSAQASGDIQIATSNAFTTILARLVMSNPAFGAASGGQATANAISPENNAPATGVAAAYRTRDRDANEVFRGTVGVTGSGADMQLSSVNISAGDLIQINSFVYIALP